MRLVGSSVNQKTWEDSQADGDHTVHPSYVHPPTTNVDADADVVVVVDAGRRNGRK